MKKTTFVLFVLLTLFVLILPAFAQEVTPVETPYVYPPNETAAVSLPPEFLAWGESVLTRGRWLLLVIFLDVALGVTVAIKLGKFQWQCLANFLNDYGPKAITWLALETLSLLPADLKALAAVGDLVGQGVFAVIFISAVGSVLASASQLGVLPGNIPGVPSAKG